MYQFFISPEQVGETHITITGSDVNHIKNVLRMKPGEEILLSDGKDKEYRCVVETLEQDAVTARILDIDGAARELPVKITLFQGLPKADKMELIIQKSVELGAVSVVPVETKRAVVRLDAKKANAKRERWQAIAESAAKQSKRTVIPEVGRVTSWQEALKQASEMEVRLIPYEEAEGMQVTREAFSGIRPGDRVAVFIGPEGGFAESEVAEAMEIGASPVTLGRRILRTETAGLFVLSVLAYLFEEN